jgi:hypothetical protein
MHISRLSEYINTIERLQDYYPSNIDGNPSIKTFCYRGICDVKYRLLPSIYRKKQDNGMENHIFLRWGNEFGILQNFIQEASGFVNLEPTELSRWMEYAQHYGVPTRLLDWTSNPMAALYFACRDANNCDGAVWLIHWLNYERFWMNENPSKSYIGKSKREIITELINKKSKIEFPMFYSPYYMDSRMSAQGGFFMIWGAKQEPLEEMLKDDNYFMKLPEKDNGIRVYGEEQLTALLFKINIYSSDKQFLLRELDLMGINEKTLFPGLDGVGRYIERRYRFDYNEAQSF